MLKSKNGTYVADTNNDGIYVYFQEGLLLVGKFYDGKIHCQSGVTFSPTGLIELGEFAEDIIKEEENKNA